MIAFRAPNPRLCASAVVRHSSSITGRVDAYSCVEVTSDVSSFIGDAPRFSVELAASLAGWEADGCKGVWLKVPVSAAGLLPVAMDEHSFVPHHANASHIMLRRWLLHEQLDTMPPPASHFVGCAGFVLNSKQELLVIQEKSGPAAKAKLWKLPGGLVAAGENLAEACVREVHEETGLLTTFDCVASVVESHHAMGPSRSGSSDLYHVCVLRCADGEEAKRLQAQEEEIAAVRWMPIKDVLQIPFYDAAGVFGFAVRAALHCAQGESTGLYNSNLPLLFRDGTCAVNAAAPEVP